MKVVVIVGNNSSISDNTGLGWYFLSDSAVTNTGKPFYIPEDYGAVTARVGWAIRFSRLGKGISSRFAYKYYHEAAPVLSFFLPDFARDLRNKGLPIDPAYNFDKALFMGDFIPLDHSGKLDLKINDSIKDSFSLKDLTCQVNDIIEKISLMNTIKMGDILIPALSRGENVRIGDCVEVMLSSPIDVLPGNSKGFTVRIK